MDDHKATGEPERYGYPDTVGDDEQRRAFIAAHYLPNSSEIAGEALVTNLALIETWLKCGAAPKASSRKLQAVLS